MELSVLLLRFESRQGKCNFSRIEEEQETGALGTVIKIGIYVIQVTKPPVKCSFLASRKVT